MAMARPTTTAMISRTTRSPSESISWALAASAATAGARAGSGDGERHLSAPPPIFPEVGGHDPGRVAAGLQPGEGGAIMVCGGRRSVARPGNRRPRDALRHGEGDLGGPPGLLLEVDRHHRGLVVAGPQPGDGDAGFLGDLQRRIARL